MSVDKFGHCSRGDINNVNIIKQNPPSLSLNVDGNFDVGNKRILNLHTIPTAENEVTSKFYVDQQHKKLNEKMIMQNESVKELHNLILKMKEEIAKFKGMMLDPKLKPVK